jgi:hypothetical protein
LAPQAVTNRPAKDSDRSFGFIVDPETVKTISRALNRST